MANATKDCPGCGAENHWKAVACHHCKAALGAWTPPPRPTRVTVVDLDLPFGSMVGLTVKWAIAAIPAVLILAVILTIVLGVLGGLGTLALLGAR